MFTRKLTSNKLAYNNTLHSRSVQKGPNANAEI